MVVSCTFMTQRPGRPATQRQKVIEHITRLGAQSVKNRYQLSLELGVSPHTVNAAIAAIMRNKANEHMLSMVLEGQPTEAVYRIETKEGTVVTLKYRPEDNNDNTFMFNAHDTTNNHDADNDDAATTTTEAE